MNDLNYTHIYASLTKEQKEKIKDRTELQHSIDAQTFPAEDLEQMEVAMHHHSSDPAELILMHSHNFTECLYIRQAEEIEYLVGTKRYVVHEGDILLIPPGVPHCPLHAENWKGNYVRDQYRVTDQFLSRLGRRFPQDYLTVKETYLLKPSEKRKARIEYLFSEGCRENEEKSYRWEDMLRGIAIQLNIELSRALLDKESRSVPPKELDQLDHILLDIERNLGEKFTLDDMAFRFHISKSTINRLFRERLDISFHKYLTKRRLIAARDKLHAGLPLEQISEEIGFGDYPTFYRAFVKEYGVSPRTYRKRS